MDLSIWDHEAVKKQRSGHALAMQQLREQAEHKQQGQLQTRRPRGMTIALSHPEYLQSIGVVAPMMEEMDLTEEGDVKANSAIEPLHDLFERKNEKVLFGLNGFIRKMNDERVYQSKFKHLSPVQKKRRRANTRTDDDFTLNFAYIEHKKPVDAYGEALSESSDDDLLRANKHSQVRRPVVAGKPTGGSDGKNSNDVLGARESHRELFQRLAREGKETYLDPHSKRLLDPIPLRDNVHMQGRQINKKYTLDHRRGAPRQSLMPVFDNSSNETFTQRFQRVASSSYDDTAADRSLIISGHSDGDVAADRDIPDDPHTGGGLDFRTSAESLHVGASVVYTDGDGGGNGVAFEKSRIHVLGDSGSDSDREHAQLRAQAQAARRQEVPGPRPGQPASSPSAARGGVVEPSAFATDASSSSPFAGEFAGHDQKREDWLEEGQAGQDSLGGRSKSEKLLQSASREVLLRTNVISQFKDSMEVRRHFRLEFADQARLATLDTDGQFTWDYALAFHTGSTAEKQGQRMPKLRVVVRALLAAGLHVGLFHSVAGNYVYCLLGASESRLQQEALRLCIDLELDKTEVFLRCMDAGLPITQMMSIELTRDINYNLQGNGGTNSAPPGWSLRGIEVVVQNKSIYYGNYHRERAVITDVESTSMQVKIRLLGDNRGKQLWVNETDLRTVIPGVGREVRVLRGEYRGCLAGVVRLDQAAKQAVVRVLEYPKDVKPEMPFRRDGGNTDVKHSDVWIPMPYNILSKAHLGSSTRDNNWKKLFGPFNVGLPGRDGFSNANRMHMYKTATRRPLKWQTLFPDSERLKLVKSIVESDSAAGCASINMSHVITDDSHPLKAAFPLHNGSVKKKLGKKWVDLKFLFFSAMHQPLADIRDYYGEEVAFYFAFMAYYNRWLLPLALLGAVFYVVSFFVDAGYITIFAPLVAIWATVFFEFWKKEESKLRVRFGMTDFSRRARDRSSFKGQWQTNRVNGMPETTYVASRKVARLVFSAFITVLALGFVTATVVSIFVLQVWMVEHWGTTYAAYCSSAVFAVQIKICDVLFSSLAYALTEFENHRHDDGFQASMVIKVYVFKFINNYNALIFIAFVKRYVTTCINDDCLEELRTHLAGIFISLLLINNFLELVGPALSRWGAAKRRRLKGISSQVELSHPEKEFDRARYETFSEYDEVSLQFGYISLFVIAFPLAPMLAFINNLFEIQFDAKRLQQLHRRPDPRGVRDIGMWYGVLTLTSMLAVVTNCAMAFLLNDLLTVADDDETDQKDASSSTVLSPSTTALWLFIGTEHVLVLLKLWMSNLISDDGAGVAEHLKQQQYLVEVLINNPFADHDLEGVWERRHEQDAAAVLQIRNPTVKCGRLMFPSFDDIQVKFAKQRTRGKWAPEVAESKDPLIFLQALDINDIPDSMPITGHELH